MKDAKEKMRKKKRRATSIPVTVVGRREEKHWRKYGGSKE